MRSRILALVGAAAVVAAIAVAIVLLSGGSSDSSLAQAAEHLNRQSVSMEFRIEPVSRNEDFVMAGTTAASADGQQARIYMHAQYQGKDIELTTLKRGSDVWVASNQFDGKLPSGKRWVHGEVKSGAQGVTPTEFAEFLSETGDVSKQGQTVIRGQKVTEYAGTISGQKLAERADAQQLLKSLGGTDMDLPVQTWLDSSGRPVRMVMTVDAGANVGKMRATMDIVGYGKPITVDAPPADQTAEQSDVKTS